MALSDNVALKSKGDLGDGYYPVAASTHIYAGAILMLNSAGYVLPAAALASNDGCVGVAAEEVNNTGSAGAASVRVKTGKFLITLVASAQTDVGQLHYASADNAASQTQASNEPVCGVLEEFVSSTSGWVRIGPESLTRALIT